MSEKNEIVVVAGADGFIGGSLVADLRRQGYTSIRAVGGKPFLTIASRAREKGHVAVDAV